MLRAKKPEAVTKRLKLFMYGAAGSGKTTAAIQFPNSYIIDCERGTENYDKLVGDSGSVVFHTTDIREAIAEVKALLNDKHGYRTLVIDPITTIYNDLLDKAEAKVGSDFGRHYGEANKQMKRLANLVMALDMNVVITAHAKPVYGQNLAKLGDTFDGWKQLDYWFDLVVELGRKGKKRFGKVVKTRIESFPDEDVFEWSYAEILRRYDPVVLEKESDATPAATPEQVAEIKDLLGLVHLPDGTVDKWFARAGVELWEDMAGDVVAKCIEYVRGRRPTTAPAADVGNAPPRQQANGNGHANGNGRPAPKAPEPDALEDVRNFRQALFTAFKGRGFTPDGQKAAIGAALNAWKAKELAALTLEQRHALLAQVAEGKADKFKDFRADVAAEAMEPAAA